ncbi:hypothetical protein CANARDRAFT_28129 [[Candida] arabinofermentans NRRL YB-2248]|uniref:Uncharacterized protein n=1 Tax=[Candida] arabinofermentans NRRL YB-2248 TaxID=983967 RepID=A0A1E4T2W9_9ASCO|nr:hypothetical protein CANARDRAFT_28129 [[Candida] arabinofermentans NRRL YB-2248]
MTDNNSSQSLDNKSAKDHHPISDWGIDDTIDPLHGSQQIPRMNIGLSSPNDALSQFLTSANDLYTPPLITPTTLATKEDEDPSYLYDSSDSKWPGYNGLMDLSISDQFDVNHDDDDDDEDEDGGDNDCDNSTVIHRVAQNKTFDHQVSYYFDNQYTTSDKYGYTSNFGKYNSMILNDILVIYEKQSQYVKLSLDKFKFEIIASSFMSDSDHIHHRRKSMISNSSTNQNKSKTTRNKIVFDLKNIPSHKLVHSHRCLLISRSLLYFTKKHILTLRFQHSKILLLLALNFFNMYSKTRDIALKLYSSTLNNRIIEFLQMNETFDEITSKHMKLIRNSANNHLNLLLGGTVSRIKQKVKTSDLLVQSLLNTLILSFNNRLQYSIHLADPLHLERYFNIYQLDLVDKNLKFINLLNQSALTEDLISVPASQRLKPLRLRSLSGDSSNTRTNTNPDSNFNPNSNTNSFTQMNLQCSLKQLSTNPNKLLQNFETMRRIFMCILLSIVEESSEPPAQNSKHFLNQCARKFNIQLPQWRYLSITTRLFMISQWLSRINALFSTLIKEMDDTELLMSLDFLEDDTIPPILEDNEDETFKKLIHLVDNLGDKLSLADLNSDVIDPADSLLKIGESITELVELFNSSMDNIRSNNSNNSNVNDSENEVATHVSLPGLNKTRGETPVISAGPKKRHSSGLNFNLVTVFEDKSGSKDLDSKENSLDSGKVIVHSESGVKELDEADGEKSGIQGKEQLKKTLEKLCGGLLDQKSTMAPIEIHKDEQVNMTQRFVSASASASDSVPAPVSVSVPVPVSTVYDETENRNENHSASIDMSTPLKLEHINVLKNELKGIFMKSL